MQDNAGDVARLRHILDAIEEIRNYNQDNNFEQFASDSMRKFATIKQLEIVGEACNHLSDATKSLSNSTPWKEIIGMRNLFVHEYFGVDEKVVWDIVVNHLEPLQTEISRLLDELG